MSSSSKVLGTVTPEQFLYTIQNGDENVETIVRAREIYKGDPQEYTLIKTHQLPCYTLNFTFHKRRKDEYINDSTGFMYLDVDGTTEINFSNPLIHATWLSLSGTGRGVLVKVKGLTPENFKYVYEDVAKALEINADGWAKKATQVNVLSYDPKLFHNSESYTYQVRKKNYHYSSITVHKDTNRTVLGGNLSGLRFDNLDELIANVEFHDDVIYDYQKKIKYVNAFLPPLIPKGKRNDTLCKYAYQVRALNPHINFGSLYWLLNNGNRKYCKPPYPSSRIREITKGVMSIVDPKPIPNKEKRFLYHPDANLSKKEKQSLSIKRLNFYRTVESKRKIEQAILDWDFEIRGKITQKGISEVTGQNIKTVQKYYPEFKSEIQFLNQEYVKPKK
jgi:hypothetical protein